MVGAESWTEEAAGVGRGGVGVLRRWRRLRWCWPATRMGRRLVEDSGAWAGGVGWRSSSRPWISWAAQRALLAGLVVEARRGGADGRRCGLGPAREGGGGDGVLAWVAEAVLEVVVSGDLLVEELAGDGRLVMEDRRWRWSLVARLLGEELGMTGGGQGDAGGGGDGAEVVGGVGPLRSEQRRRGGCWCRESVGWAAKEDLVRDAVGVGSRGGAWPDLGEVEG